MQVEKAVVTYAGFEPTTFFLLGKCSTTELVCKLLRLGHEVKCLIMIPHKLVKLYDSLAYTNSATPPNIKEVAGVEPASGCPELYVSFADWGAECNF